ncbi:hypothetical protein F511_03967 [Dorcoceras hygrometricum]|uniref:Uncharacterized protein n=1 Tax=Dorcoceras hygrometricum TaxID=472368 RepID=A0A2Z7B099_9LAMI|nr:hypothetical protein F511_03967 [Dorcoceras hygrometricum]
MSRCWCNQMSTISQRSWRVAKDLLALACGQEQMSTLVNMSYFCRLPSIPAVVLSVVGSAELSSFSSFDYYPFEAVERLEEESVKLLVYEDFWRNLTAHPLALFEPFDFSFQDLMPWIVEARRDLFRLGRELPCPVRISEVFQDLQLVEVLIQLVVPQEVVRVSQLCIVFICTGITAGGMSRMPPRRRGRGRGQFQESEGQNEDRRSVPLHGRGRNVEDEVDDLTARVDSMEIVMARFQRMSPQVFNSDESPLMRTLGYSISRACSTVCSITTSLG